MIWKVLRVGGWARQPGSTQPPKSLKLWVSDVKRQIYFVLGRPLKPRRPMLALRFSFGACVKVFY